MLKEKVGLVSEEEKNEIKAIFQRRLALKELLMTINNPSLPEADKDDLYRRIVDDLTKNRELHEKWWKEMPLKYHWKWDENSFWSIDFDTNEIFLVQKNQLAV